jgi:hypothetical protein
MSRRVTVHHFVANDTTRTYGPGNPTSDLLGVDYWHDVPADAEFPRTILRMHLFARFYLDQARPTDFSLRVSWLDHPSGAPLVIGEFGPFTVNFRQDETARDVIFHLRMIHLEGVGRHSVELLREWKRGWRAGELVPIARTHFLVER